MAWNCSNARSDCEIKEIDIPTVILPYQFEPLAIDHPELQYSSDLDSTSSEEFDEIETDSPPPAIETW